MRRVRMLRGHFNLMKGEVAGFATELAETLIRDGIAVDAEAYDAQRVAQAEADAKAQSAAREVAEAEAAKAAAAEAEARAQAAAKSNKSRG